MPQPLLRAAIAASFILGSVPASLILDDPPAAMAAPVWAQEPPPGPQLSGDEQQALDDEKAGRPVKDPKVLSSAKSKLNTQEKYKGERNQQKQRGGPRRR
jgi:hypothetical protein